MASSSPHLSASSVSSLAFSLNSSSLFSMSARCWRASSTDVGVGGRPDGFGTVDGLIARDRFTGWTGMFFSWPCKRKLSLLLGPWPGRVEGRVGPGLPPLSCRWGVSSCDLRETPWSVDRLTIAVAKTDPWCRGWPVLRFALARRRVLGSGSSLERIWRS